MIWTRNGYAPSLDAKKRHCMAPPGQGKEQLCSGKDLPRISEKLHGKGDARPRSELIGAAPQWLRIERQAAAAAPICSETAMLRIESSALERHCRAEIYNAWATL